MELNFKKKVLSNGLTILFEKRDLPVVSVAFAVRAGGINETLEEKGISHFIEHMLYKGTPTRNAKKIAEEIEWNGGDLNGFTSEEVVAFWCKMPSDKLDVALEVLGDMVKNSLFDEKELEKERKVIFEEIKMRHDNPMIFVFDEIQKELYDGTMKIDIIGTHETMEKVDREKMVKKFKDIYQPDNLILSVVGDADFDELVNFCEKNFGEGKSEIVKSEFGLKNEIKISTREGIDQAHIVFGYHIPMDKHNYTAQVLSCLMAEGMSSRLFNEIRMKRNLAYAIKGGSDINKNFAYNFIYVGAMKENVDEIKKLILEEFQKVSENLEEEELQKTKDQLIGQYNISMEDSQNQLVNILGSEIQGNAEEFYEFPEKISNVSLEDVKKMAGEVKEGNYSFFALVPK